MVESAALQDTCLVLSVCPFYTCTSGEGNIVGVVLNSSDILFISSTYLTTNLSITLARAVHLRKSTPATPS